MEVQKMAHIYKIVKKDGSIDDCYVGSSETGLKMRWAVHKSDYKKKNITGTIIAYPSDSRTWITTFISDRG